MTPYDVRKSALESLISSKEAGVIDDELGNPELEFFCEWVILHAADPAIIHMWTEYNATFNGGATNG